MMETIAEMPNDYGQTIRAVFIFKYSNGPNTSHYEKLSEEFRHYNSIKNKQSN